jgi:hypothetical protein
MNDSEYDDAYYAEIARKRSILKKGFLIGIVIVSIMGIGVWQFVLPHTANTVLGSTTELTDQQIIRKVGSHIVLPTGETPKIITVTNVNDMRKTQPFFASASNGDKLLIYSTKVILYNATSDRVIDIAQIKYTPDQK